MSEKELSYLIYEKTGEDKNFGMIRSKGDRALFGGNTTKEMKKRLGVSNSRPLADFLEIFCAFVFVVYCGWCANKFGVDNLVHCASNRRKNT